MTIDAAKIQPEHAAFLDNHFGVSRQWSDFNKKLKSKDFQAAVVSDTRSDDKLKTFVNAIAMREQAKGPSLKAVSDTSGSYKIRYHPSADRFSCTCPDWTYKRSHDDKSDCKHIERVKSSSRETLMAKTKSASANPAEVLFSIGRVLNRRQKDLQVASDLKEENQAFNQSYPQESFVKAWLKKAAGVYKVPPMLKEAYARRAREDFEMAKKMARAAKGMLSI